MELTSRLKEMKEIHERFNPATGSCTKWALIALRRPHCIEVDYRMCCIMKYSMLRAHDQWNSLSDFTFSCTSRGHHGESMLHHPSHTSLGCTLIHDVSSRRENTRPHLILMVRSYSDLYSSRSVVKDSRRSTLCYPNSNSLSFLYSCLSSMEVP